jgi:hypothetical protein
MPTTPNVSPSSCPPFIRAWPDAFPWFDAWSQWLEGWFEWQRAVWQPVIDAQAEYLFRWQEQSGLPALGLAPLRGGEQLA